MLPQRLHQGLVPHAYRNRATSATGTPDAAEAGDPKRQLHCFARAKVLRYCALLCLFFAVATGVLVVEGRSSSRNYYQILGVKKTATLTEIKKSYRRLSLQYHPDRNKSAEATERFSELAAAYEVLSDKTKRAIYDEHGEEGLKHYAGNENDGGNPYDIFNFFNPFGFGSHGRNRGEEKAPSITFRLYVSLQQLYFGEVLQMSFKRRVVCSASEDCFVHRPSCVGAGVKMVTQRLGPGFVVQNQVQDEGCVAAQKGWKDNCSACPKGPTEDQIGGTTVFVDAGMFDGDTITVQGAGVQKLGYRPGDIIFRLAALPDPSFKRRGHNLETTVYITLLEALTGFTKTFRHINDNVFSRSRTTVTHDGEVDIVPGLGMPIRSPTAENTSDFGDLHITYRVQFPVSLDAAAQELVTKALQGVSSWKHQAPVETDDRPKV